MKKLKDKVWHACTIKIERLVEQYVDGAMTTNKTIAFLVTIKDYPNKIMFRADSTKELWDMIKHETRLEPLKKI